MASEYRGLGLNGGEYINDTAVHTGNWFATQATEKLLPMTRSPPLARCTTYSKRGSERTLCCDYGGQADHTRQ